MLKSTGHEITMLMYVEMQTIAGILTFISMVNTTSERLKERKGFIFQHFIFFEQFKFHTRVEHVKSFIISVPGSLNIRSKSCTQSLGFENTIS